MTDILSKQISGVLENAIFNQINSLNLKIPNATARAITSRVAEVYAVEIASTVFKTSNQQLTSIPANMIGIKNPVNLITGNLGSAGVTNNLSNILDVQLTSQITDKLVTALEAELKQKLPANTRNLINFGGLAATLVQSLTPTVSGVVGTALSSFTDSLFGRGGTPKQLIPNVDQLFASFTGNPAQALDRIDENFAQTSANKYLNQAKNFDINNKDNQEKLVVLKKGFTDPDANYPTKEYAGRSDTNKLATGDVAGTIIQDKNNNRMKGAKLPGGEAWDEPESAYKGEYPYNKVTQTESGHIIEIDDTPGAERLHIYHKAGTYIEIDSNGSVIRRTKGSSYEIIDRNGKIAISGEADISVNGACNIFVGNDANIEVEGDVNLTCHNDITAQAGGTINLSAAETMNLTSPNINIQAYQVMNLKSNVDMRLYSEEMHFKANVDMYSSATTLYQNTETSYHQTGSSMYEKVGGSKFTQTEGSIHNKAGGDINNDGTNFHMNSGTSSDSEPSKAANVAAISNIGTIPGRKDIVYFNLYDPSPLTLNDSVTLDMEEQSASKAEKRAHEDRLRTTGIASTKDLNQKPVAQDSADISSTQGISVPGNKDLINATKLPGNYNLSPNFTLEMLSSKAAITKDQIESTELTYGQIVYNLQLVALNVLEPVYNLYPNAFVTSGFRARGKSTGTSQHPLGHAVDIQFKGASKADYFEIAKRLAKVLKYDQLLLEFSAYTNNPWIHISYTGKNDRSQVLTFWNNKTHSQGLTQLA